MPSLIKWTKQYVLPHEDGNFKVMLSEHEGKQFYATLIYFERKSYATTGDPLEGPIIFRHENFSAKSEGELLAQLKKWISEKLPGAAELKEVPS
jgi:hypothetical protein